MTAVTDTPQVSHHNMPNTAAAPAARADVTVRAETVGDAGWVEQLHALAFGPGRFARAAFRVRERIAVDETLSRVAEIGGQPVSSVRMTPISLSGENGFLLGPLATDPAFRNMGAGKLLVREVTGEALARGSGDFVLLVGDAPYYEPLGFTPTTPGAITLPGPVDPRRILACCRNTDHAQRLKGAIAPFRRS